MNHTLDTNNQPYRQHFLAKQAVGADINTSMPDMEEKISNPYELAAYQDRTVI